MKIIVHKGLGNFHYPEKFCRRYHLDRDNWLEYDYDDEYRFHNFLIDWILKNPEDSEGLRVINIPEEATDWDIIDYGGSETVVYVVNGKLMWA